MNELAKSFFIGRQAEEYVVKLLKGCGVEAEHNESESYKKKQEFDIKAKISKKKFTLEVKFDVMACRTGNVAIEFWNSKKNEPSGLSATKADIWSHVILDDNNMTVWMANCDTLREFVEDNPTRTLMKAGDNNAAIYLYPEDDILGVVLHRFETLPEKKMQQLIRKLLK